MEKFSLFPSFFGPQPTTTEDKQPAKDVFDNPKTSDTDGEIFNQTAYIAQESQFSSPQSEEKPNAERSEDNPILQITAPTPSTVALTNLLKTHEQTARRIREAKHDRNF